MDFTALQPDRQHVIGNATYGPVAQWLEQSTHNRLVGGSNPSGPTPKSRLVLNLVAFFYSISHSGIENIICRLHRFLLEIHASGILMILLSLEIYVTCIIDLSGTKNQVR